LLVWKGHHVVLDGHTRRALSIQHKKSVKVREVELPDEKAAIAYIFQIQRQRRNLTREALSYFRGAEYHAVKQQRGGKRERKAKGQSDPLPSTAVVLAEKYGVSDKTVKRDAIFALAIDRIVEEYGDSQIKRKLLSADVRLTYGTARKLLRLSAAERKTAINQLIEQGDLPHVKKEKKSPGKPKDVAQSLIARLRAKGDRHARAVVQQMATLLGLEMEEKGTSQANRPRRRSGFKTSSRRSRSRGTPEDLWGIM
jgi:hypothetical protein